MKKSLVMAFTVLALAASSAVADAATITLDLTSDHCTGTCGGAVGGAVAQTSFGTVTLTDTVAGTVAVNITLLNGNRFVTTGFDGVVGFNLIGNPSVSYTGVTSGFVGQNYGPYTQFDGFGTFEYAITATFGNGAPGVAGPLNFTVTGAGLTSASFLEKSTAGDDLAYFGVDILSGTTGKTGLVDASVASVPDTPVPDGGSTAALLGSALLAFGIVRGKRSKA